MNARDELFFRLRGDGRAQRDASELTAGLDRVFENLPAARQGEALLERFLSRLEEAGGEGRVHASLEDFSAWMHAEAVRVGATSVLLASHRAFHGAFAASIGGDGITVHRLPDGTSALDRAAAIETAAAADFGIGMADAGFADSGAIAVSASRNESRSLSLLPETHVAVLREEDIVSDMAAAAASMTAMLAEDRTSAITLVAGPSKTADIEKVLVTGVHGPRRFLVAVIRKAAPAAQS